MSKATSHYIFSTLTSDQVYTRTAQGGADLPVTTASVFIAGGTNVPDKYLITKYGVMTAVTDEEMQVLLENEVFKLHQKNGFITIRDKPADAEKVAADMETRDQSAPLVDADFEEDKKPIAASDDKPKSGNSRRA